VRQDRHRPYIIRYERYRAIFLVLVRKQRREAEINEALQREAARQEAAIKNMQPLRALRLAINPGGTVLRVRRVTVDLRSA
jgi:hypothetical protein